MALRLLQLKDARAAVMLVRMHLHGCRTQGLRRQVRFHYQRLLACALASSSELCKKMVARKSEIPPQNFRRATYVDTWVEAVYGFQRAAAGALVTSGGNQRMLNGRSAVILSKSSICLNKTRRALTETMHS